ncbi:hypothetical protein CPC08DRAFT_822424 [Agrocybe pediades]|nr:hypothetical protein CPC08DRAFT_822424 [Agrocybe pediades]
MYVHTVVACASRCLLLEVVNFIDSSLKSYIVGRKGRSNQATNAAKPGRAPSPSRLPDPTLQTTCSSLFLAAKCIPNFSLHSAHLAEYAHALNDCGYRPAIPYWDMDARRVYWLFILPYSVQRPASVGTAHHVQSLPCSSKPSSNPRKSIYPPSWGVSRTGLLLTSKSISDKAIQEYCLMRGIDDEFTEFLTCEVEKALATGPAHV